MTEQYREKLIEMAIPLEAISAREVDPPRSSIDGTPLVGSAARQRKLYKFLRDG
jgi:hypothetical protein